MIGCRCNGMQQAKAKLHGRAYVPYLRVPARCTVPRGYTNRAYVMRACRKKLARVRGTRIYYY